MNAPELWPHQQATLALALARNELFDTSDPGCVSSDTEFLTPTGWVRIADYRPGMLVGQIQPSTLQLEFIEPLAYVNKQCSIMHRVAPARGLSMELSSEHRVLYYTRQDDLTSWKVCSAREYVESPRTKLIASTFVPPEHGGLEVSDDVLRLAVAVAADGHFGSPSTNRCVVRLKKICKIERMRKLLEAAEISFSQRICGGQDPGFHVFSFNAPLRDKHFDAKYWGCSGHQLEVISEECLLWDGTESEGQFYSRNKESADFIQYVFSSLGYPASLSSYLRDDGKTDYVVHRRPEKTPFVGRVRPGSISQFRPKDGRKYCFTTPTSFWLARHNGRIFVTGNTGKTAAHINAFAEHHRQGLSSKCLVVCPKSLMGPAWAEDIKRFQPSLTVSLAYAERRADAFAAKADIYILNADGVKYLDKLPREKFEALFPEDSTLLIDEVTAFKNHSSQRSKAMLRVSKRFKYRRALTGTPNPNSVTELWHPALLLDGGERLGTRFYQFRSNVQTPTEERGFTRWADKPESLEVVAYLLRDMTVRHEFDKVMNVPPIYNRYVEFDVAPKLMAAYEKSIKNNVVAIKDYIERDILPANSAVLVNKLLQLLSGAVYDADGSYQMLDRGRYELISDLVAERDHSLVFISWEHQLRELSKQFTSRGISHAVLSSNLSSDQRLRLVQDYQRGAYQTLILHPKTGAHGLTLTRGRAVIWASPRYEADYMRQGIARIRRGVQDKKTENIMLCARGTLEYDVYQKLTTKVAKMDDLLSIMATD